MDFEFTKFWFESIWTPIGEFTKFSMIKKREDVKNCGPVAIEIEPIISINYELDMVTFSGAVGKTYEVEVSKNLKDWNVTHSFTLKEDSETYPISYFIQERPRRSFFRLKYKQER